jgi:hypothetical protein
MRLGSKERDQETLWPQKSARWVENSARQSSVGKVWGLVVDLVKRKLTWETMRVWHPLQCMGLRTNSFVRARRRRRGSVCRVAPPLTRATVPDCNCFDGLTARYSANVAVDNDVKPSVDTETGR